MDNPRPEKVAVVAEVKDRLSQSDGVMVTEYRGLSVHQLAELRTNLRSVGGKYRVYKNTLVKRAVAEAEISGLSDLMVGPTALAFTDVNPDGVPGDVVDLARTLRDFSKGQPNLVLKGGLLDGEFIDADGVKALADVEPRDVLLSRFAGALQAPMQNFASLLEAVPRNFAYGLKALIEKGGGVDAPESEAVEQAQEATAVPAQETTEQVTTEEPNGDSDE